MECKLEKKGNVYKRQSEGKGKGWVAGLQSWGYWRLLQSRGGGSRKELFETERLERFQLLTTAELETDFESEELQEGGGEDKWGRGGERNEKSVYWKVHLGSNNEIATNSTKGTVRKNASELKGKILQELKGFWVSAKYLFHTLTEITVT